MKTKKPNIFQRIYDELNRESWWDNHPGLMMLILFVVFILISAVLSKF